MYVHMLNALCWDFRAEDHEIIARLRVFDALLRGDNREFFNPILRAWGREKTHFSKGLSLASHLRQVFEFLCMTMFNGVFVDPKPEQLYLDSAEE